MNKSTLLSQSVFYVFVLLIALIIWLTFSIKPIQLNNEATQLNRPDFEFEDVVITHVSNGEKVFSIEASNAEIYKKTEQLLLHNIFGVIYENDKASLLFESPTGFFDMMKQDINLSDTQSLFVQTDYVTVLMMDNLNWNAQNFKGIGDGNVSISNKQFSITSDKVIFDIYNKEIKLDSNIQAMLNTQLNQ